MTYSSAVVDQSLLQEVVSIDPQVLSGTPCFAGTRVPVQTLLDYPEEGDTIDEFLADFRAVQRSQAIKFLNLPKTS